MAGSPEFVSPAGVAAALSQAITAAKGGDPLAPVYVLVPSGASGRSLGHRLGRSGGVVNVRFLTLSRLAEALTAGRLDVPRVRRLGDDLRRELARIVASEARPPLDHHASPALVQTLVRAFGELRDRTDTEIEALESEGPLAGELVRLYRRFVELAAPYADERALVEAAEAVVDDTTPPVIAVVHEPPAGHAALLIERVRAVGRLRVIAMVSGDPVRDEALGVWFGGLASPPAARLPAIDHIVVAPDAETEVQLAIGEMLLQAEAGVPFPRMALLFAARSPYGLIAHEQLRAAGVPWSGYSPLLLSHSVAGRFLLTLTAMVAERFSRRTVLDWLAASPIRNPETGRTVPAARWRAVATLARVGSGPHSWEERLAAFASVKTAEDEDDRDAEAALGLASFITPLQAWAGEPRSTWGGWASWAQDAIDRYLGSSDRRNGWPDVERQAADDVEAVLLQTSRLDELDVPVSIEVFSAAIADELRKTQSRLSDRDGIFVGTFAEAVGCDFDFVAGCGLAEGVLPSRAPANGVLAVLQAPGVERRVDDERRAFLLGIGAGRRVVLSAPRADQRSQRESRPSPWLLEQARLLTGKSITADELMTPSGDRPWLTVVPSFAAYVAAPPVTINPQHDVVHALASTSAGDREAAIGALGTGPGRAVATIRARDSSLPTEYDGVIGPDESLAVEGRTMSPTRLEDWAICPFRYYLKTVLRVGEQVEEDDPFGMAALDRGKLVHAALENFIREADERTSVGQAWSDEERARLVEIGEQLHEEVHRSGRSPGGLLREAELLTLRDNLMSVLDEDENMRRRFGVLPGKDGVEVGFGGDDGPPIAVQRPHGSPVTFRGRIDRLDRSGDGSFAVAFDYKTGKPRQDHRTTAKDDCVAAGTKLQLAVYAMEAERALGPEASIRAHYWFTSQPAKQTDIGFAWDDAAKERATAVIGQMAGGIEGGVFPLVPGEIDRESFENCRYCPFDDICPSDRAEAWARKGEHDAVGVYRGLGGDGA